ncbi:unnamed protein product [Arctia plantaginis]|uniref:Major facilitator superfamily (MFS) profile domain-containing protein n=1 Tax=Arctia plantaginis TaxID=874455 RepID=A0A8S0Z5F9_ARCPL|nr:unnamed protein product [Arctia plantaginis]
MLKFYDSPLLRQYAVVIVVNLCVLATGTGVVWPSPVLVKLNNSTQPVLSRPITEEEGSWIVSIGSISGIASNFLIAFLVDIVGRKYGLILACLPKLVAGFIFIFATEVWLVLLGRALVGISDSAIFTLVPMYASEIASKDIRGGLGTILQIMCSFGVVIMLSLGPFISYINLNITYTCINLLTTIPLFILPDSPYFLYSKGRTAEALKVLTFCRGSEALAHEELKEYEAVDGKDAKINKRDIFANKLFQKSLILVVIFSIGCQFAGFNAVSFYLQTVLESTQTSVKPEFASVIIGVIQLVASFGTTFMTDKFGRKPILTVTGFGMALGMLGLGIFFKLKETVPVTGFLNYVPLISLILVVYSFSAGLGSLFWVVGAELFDDKSRGIGMSICLMATTIAMFLTTKYFAFFTSAIGAALTYWIFSINCVLMCLFIMFFIPETKAAMAAIRLIALVLAVSAVTLCDMSDGNETIMRPIPEGLKLGVATSNYQIEGAWNVSGKTPSIWDTYCHTTDRIKDGSTGDDACKSYEFYQRDIQMMKYLGIDFYRFSIAWTRVLPSGFANIINQDGIDYYNRLIDELIANGIEPMVTMYHWDLPQTLQDLGGWTNPFITEWFEDYARVLYEAYGDRVKTWITINEPKQLAIFGYGMTRFAPDMVSPGIGDYMAVKNILLAHARAYHLYDKVYRKEQKGVCGITIATDFREGATNSSADIELGNLAMDFEVGLYSHPIFSTTGGFPKDAVKRVAEKSAQQGFPRTRLPQLTHEEAEYIKGTSDFFGFNHYSTKFYTEKGYTQGSFPIPSYDDDIGGLTSYLNYKQAPVIHSTAIPNGMRKALNWVRETCNNPRILITENGYGDLGGADDEDRVQYYKDYLGAVLSAIEDGCNVATFTAWSLMDNFEWDGGYGPKFGLFDVDFDDDKRTRKPKTSAVWYKNVIATRKLDPNYTPELQDISF